MSEHRIAAGVYPGRGIASSEQYGTSQKGTDQIAVDLNLSDFGERVTTFLYFSDAAAQYSIERLRAMGWEGDDLSNLAGIDRNIVNVEIKFEMYDGKEQMKVQILTGGGRVVLQNTMNDQAKRAFGARFKNLAAQSRAGSSPAGSGSGTQSTSGTGFPFGANAPKQQQSGGVKL